MAFNDLLKSRFGARPVQLFRFEYQGAIWWFARADRDIETPGGTTWRAASIDRDDIQQTNERAKDALKIRIAYLRDPNAPALDIPATQTLGDLWHPFVPCDRVNVMCLEWMFGDTDAPKMVWSGVVLQPQFTDVQLELSCRPNISFGENKGQGPRAQRACWKVPYSTGLDGCNLDPDDFDIAGTVTAVDGLTVTVPEFASPAFSLLQGELRWPRTITAHNGDIEITERRTLMAVGGADVTLLYSGAGLAAGVEVAGRPGCPGTYPACEARGNLINHGGAAYKPVKSPYGGGESMSWG